jgi:hypothetical protein
MPADEYLAHRMFSAVNAFERALGRKLTLAQLGERVAAEEVGREAPYAPSVVARWVRGEQEPGTRGQWVALARALQVDPGWLAFGPESAAPAPAGYVELPRAKAGGGGTRVRSADYAEKKRRA